MKYQNIGTMIDISGYMLGCMRIHSLPQKDIEKLIKTSLDAGINCFDHADIYGKGESETLFGKAAIGISRDKMYIQSKCGITNKHYNNSSEHILTSVDCILQRLKTDYLDSLLIHRPDTYSDPMDTAKAFEQLYKTGKVRNFGVSNFNPMQIELLQKYSPVKLCINQMQFSLAVSGMIDEGVSVNTQTHAAQMRDGSILNYVRIKDITIQAWSPLQFGFFEGVFIDHEKYPELNKNLQELSKKYGVSKTAIAISWINSHPASIQTILGTTSPARIQDIAKGSDIKLEHSEWYELYKSAGNILP